MQIVSSIVFFLFLAGVAFWLFRMWWSVAKKIPAYRAAYRQISKNLIMGDLVPSREQLKTELPTPEGIAILFIGGVTWVIIGYFAVAGLIMTGIYIFS